MKYPPRESGAIGNDFGLKGWAYGGRYRIERYLYTLQRITGLGILLYLPMHLLVTGQKLDQRQWETVMGLVARGTLPVGEFLVFVAGVFHALNGLRLIVVELGGWLHQPGRPVYPFRLAADRQRPAVVMVFLLSAAIIGYGAYEFFFSIH